MPKGKIRVKVHRAEVPPFGQAPTGWYLYKRLNYDEEGREVASVEYDSNESLINEIRTLYDESGKVIQKELTSGDGNTEVLKSSYNEEGKVVGEDLLYDGEIYQQALLELDDNGFEKSRIKKDATGKVLERDEMTNTVSGKLLTQAHYDDKDVKVWEKQNTYNEGDNLIKELYGHYHDKVVEITTHAYDEEGRRILTEKHDPKGTLLSRVSLTYNSNGHPVRFESETEGYAPAKVIQQAVYDEDGRILETEWFDVKNSYLLAREKHAYDEDGDLKNSDIFELNPSDAKKNHYQLTYNYTTALDDDEEADLSGVDFEYGAP